MRNAPPTRRVVIVKDNASPLWVLRCQRPCAVDNMNHPTWCMPAVGDPGCYLSGASTEHGARVLATACGYTVVEKQEDAA